MNKSSRRLPAIQEALRRLGNPYASLQIFDEGVDELEARSLSVPERAYVRLQGNQYTSLSLVNPDSIAADPVSAVRLGVSKANFNSSCRQILRQYVPAMEKGRLRPHHKAFIARNQKRSPLERNYLLAELRRYDLSNVLGLQGHFNREPVDLTADKLKKIELKVFGDSK